MKEKKKGKEENPEHGEFDAIGMKESVWFGRGKIVKKGKKSVFHVKVPKV